MSVEIYAFAKRQRMYPREMKRASRAIFIPALSIVPFMARDRFDLQDQQGASFLSTSCDSDRDPKDKAVATSPNGESLDTKGLKLSTKEENVIMANTSTFGLTIM